MKEIAKKNGAVTMSTETIDLLKAEYYGYMKGTNMKVLTKEESTKAMWGSLQRATEICTQVMDLLAETEGLITPCVEPTSGAFDQIACAYDHTKLAREHLTWILEKKKGHYASSDNGGSPK